MSVRHLEQWRQTAADRGFRQDLGGWLTPGGERVPAEFVQRVCSSTDPAPAVEAERRDCA